MKRWLSITLGFVVVLIVAAALFFFLPAKLEPVQASARQPTGAALIARGKYLATAADCVACHSIEGGRPHAGGLAFKLPFGTIYSSNITPDKRHGIGAWSDAQFVRAMKHGIDDQGRELYPAFPYTAYANMSTDDVLAIRAYLNTVEPVGRSVEPNKLTFPFNQRYLMRGWKLLNGTQHPWKPDARRSAEWNRGAYLVEGAGHCGECHTPRNIIYGLKKGQKFAGAVTQGWKAYNITSDRQTGVGGWSIDEIARYLGTGHSAGRGAASGSMAEAVSLSLSKLTPSDLRAMAVYLHSVPARHTPQDGIVEVDSPAVAASTLYSPPASEARGISTGLALYEGACASCHGWNGEGVQTSYASLRGAQTVNDPTATNLVQVILRGSAIQAPEGHVSMPSFAALSDTEVAAVSNYVLQHFGNKKATVTPARVAEARKQGE